MDTIEGNRLPTMKALSKREVNARLELCKSRGVVSENDDHLMVLCELGVKSGRRYLDGVNSPHQRYATRLNKCWNPPTN
ncbi:hypothetical protein HanRHA438_Chr12g0561021 [Helianthus annuus]|nr:hypothetical protein HanRHA438_Chr12g0561021 [Helianthus annuus]